MLYLALVPLFLLLGWAILTATRNNRTLSFQFKLIDQISAAIKIDIEMDRTWRWRWDEFDAVSYTKMVFMFWKPFTSFYTTDPTREIK